MIALERGIGARAHNASYGGDEVGLICGYLFDADARENDSTASGIVVAVVAIVITFAAIAAWFGLRQ